MTMALFGFGKKQQEDPATRMERANSQFEEGCRHSRKKDWPSAWKCFFAAAEVGHADAQFKLGEMYEYARGVIKNCPEAVHWYTRAAEQGHAEAQYRLGYLHDVVIPREQLRKNEVKALCGKKVECGDSTFKTFCKEQAVRWYAEAAEQGHAEAAAKLKKLAETENETV
jgi:TPR repeat protein